jgi:dihydroorotate dehydrogenase electron transfer subunit
MRTIDSVRVTKIERTIQNSGNIRTLIFSDARSVSSAPGQFAMIWLPDVGEFPMSLSLAYGKKSSIVVKAMGNGSRELFNAKKGDLIGIRGPYGSSFEILKNTRKVLLIGGGTGIAPILKLAKDITLNCSKKVDTKMVIGAKKREELPFLKITKKLLGIENVYPTTDDGSLGSKGFAHTKVAELVEEFDFDAIYACGPERMMYEIYKISKDNSIPVQFSLERVMKCGIAICGSCCIQDIVLCRDGPVLDNRQLSRVTKEFGRYERDKTGALISKS